MLYPVKFKPILKDVIWGGTRLRDTLGKSAKTNTCGESWEISAVQGKISVVDNGVSETDVAGVFTFDIDTSELEKLIVYKGH